MGVYIWNKLPSEYQEVEYIQSNGSQHINTGYIPNYNTKIACKFNHDNNSTDQSIFGARGNNNANEYTLWSTPTVNTSTSVAVFNKTSGSNLTKYAYNTDIEFEYNKSGWKYGTQSGTWSPSSGTPNLDLFIFTINTNGTADSRKFKGKLYYFKIRDNGTLVRDFIPCYRKSDSVIGLYDLVNNQFYTNSGTGTFTKGSDVNTYRESSLKNAYIGEVWTPGANTLLYLPLESDTVDKSEKSVSTTATGISYTTVGGVTSAHIGSTGGISVAAGAVTKDLSEMTISVLFYLPTATYSSRRILMEFNNNSYCNFSILDNANGSTMQTGYIPTMSISFSGGVWTSLIITGSSSGYCMYKDGTLVSTGTGSSTPRWTGTGSSTIGQYIFCGRAGTSNTPFVNGNIREVIFEKTKRSEDDVSNYYSMIKQKLGF